MTYRELFYKATRLIDNNKITLGEYDEMTKPLDREVEQEPTAKNNLVVDCISRADARSLICNTDIKYHISGMSRKVFKDLYNGMDELPSATPIRPKGHWIWCGGSHKCSNCGEYTCFSHKVKYCPNCGSDNREVEDGNE